MTAPLNQQQWSMAVNRSLGGSGWILGKIFSPRGSTALELVSKVVKESPTLEAFKTQLDNP